MIYRTYTIVGFVALILEFCDVMKTIVILILLLSFLDYDLINYCAGDKSAEIMHVSCYL
jgi:hypothetical protein